MKINLIAIVLSLILSCVYAAQAADSLDNESDDVEQAVVSDGVDEAENLENKVKSKAKLIPLSRKNKGAEADEIDTEVEPLSAVDQMSLYVKELNLSSEQIDLAKYISDDSRVKQEQLLKSVYILKEQAIALEEKTLQDFRAILTPEQRKKFDNLRAWYEKQYDLKTY